jgi:protein gp37
MADGTQIEWTHRAGTKGETWNPLAGCSILTPGCTHCYAMRMAGRIEAINAAAGTPTHYAGTTRKVNGNTVWTGKLALAPDHILTAPLAWKTPRTVFVNSMSDLFHEDVPDAWIDQVFAIMPASREKARPDARWRSKTLLPTWRD